LFGVFVLVFMGFVVCVLVFVCMGVLVLVLVCAGVLVLVLVGTGVLVLVLVGTGVLVFVLVGTGVLVFVLVGTGVLVLVLVGTGVLVFVLVGTGVLVFVLPTVGVRVLVEVLVTAGVNVRVGVRVVVDVRVLVIVGVLVMVGVSVTVGVFSAGPMMLTEKSVNKVGSCIRELFTFTISVSRVTGTSGENSQCIVNRPGDQAQMAMRATSKSPPHPFWHGTKLSAPEAYAPSPMPVGMPRKIQGPPSPLHHSFCSAESNGDCTGCTVGARLQVLVMALKSPMYALSAS